MTTSPELRGTRCYVAWGAAPTGPLNCLCPDDSGTLVAIRKYTDTPSYCRDTSFDLWYGPVLDCELEPGEDFCDEGQ